VIRVHPWSWQVFESGKQFKEEEKMKKLIAVLAIMHMAVVGVAGA